jgi:hypothetical protein
MYLKHRQQKQKHNKSNNQQNEKKVCKMVEKISNHVSDKLLFEMYKEFMQLNSQSKNKQKTPLN